MNHTSHTFRPSARPAHEPGMALGWVIILWGLAMALLLTSGGCSSMSQGQRLYTAHATYTQALRSVNVLMETGVIKDQKTKDVIWQAKNECHDALAAADRQFVSGNTLGLSFTLRRVESALDALIRIHLNYTSKTSGDPAAASAVEWSLARRTENLEAMRRDLRTP